MNNNHGSEFEESMLDVVPLDHTHARVSARQKDTARIRSNLRQIRENATTANQDRTRKPLIPIDIRLVDPDEWVEWKCSGVQPYLMQKLKRGDYKAQGKLDLHQQSLPQAAKQIHRFIENSVQSQLRTVLVVHGLGYQSKPPAQMKSHVAYWLEDHPKVNAFVTAPRQMGGAGATLIFLKKSHKAKETTRERIEKRLS